MRTQSKLHACKPSTKKLRADSPPALVEIPKPPGYHSSLSIAAVLFDAEHNDVEALHLAPLDIRHGDRLVILETSDVQSYDLAAVDEGEGTRIGRIFTAPGERFKFESSDGLLILRADAVKGRVVGVLRGGRYVGINIMLRPCAPLAADLEWSEVTQERGEQ